MRISLITFCAVVVVFLASSLAVAQLQEITLMNHRFVPEGLQVTVNFNRDISTPTTSKLTYQTTNSAGDEFAPRDINFAPINNQTLVFLIPRASLENVKEVDYFVTLARSNRVIKVFPKHSVDLTFYEEQLKAAKTDLEATKTELKTKTNESESRKTELDKARVELNAKQTQLNQVLEGIRPTNIVFDSVNLVTDEKIVVSFNTNKPTRISAIITGVNGIRIPVKTEDVTTKHTVIFDGLPANSPYTIDAEALDLATNNPIEGVDVKAEREARLRISTKNRINPPTATVSHAASSNNIKIKVVRPDQNVFTEIQYRQLDENGEATGRLQTLGKIKPDTFGNFSSEESVASQSEKEFELANLKENTQYEVEVKLVNDIGKQTTNSFRRIIRTAPKPTPFDFDKEVDVQLNPLGIKVKWNSTTKAEKATIQAIYSNGDTLQFGAGTVKIADNVISADITTAEAVRLIQKNEVPVLRLTMTSGQSSVIRDLKVSFIMPTKSEVTSNTAISGTVKNSLLEVTDGIEKNKKIDWKKILGAGLSLVVRTVL